MREGEDTTKVFVSNFLVRKNCRLILFQKKYKRATSKPVIAMIFHLK